MRALADVTPLLVAHQGNGLAVEAADAGHDRSVVRERAIAVQLDEVVEDSLDVVQRVRPVLMAGKLDGAPDLVRARLLRDPVDLVLETGQLPGNADPAQKREVPEPGKALA